MTSDRSAKRYYGELRYCARADVTMSASFSRSLCLAVKRVNRDGHPRVLSRIVDCSEVPFVDSVITFVRALAPLALDKDIFLQASIKQSTLLLSTLALVEAMLFLAAR